MYTFRFIVGNIFPKSVKCIHSATMGTVMKSISPSLNHNNQHALSNKTKDQYIAIISLVRRLGNSDSGGMS